jgi:hypothetical protein
MADRGIQPLEIGNSRLNAGAVPQQSAYPLLKAVKRYEPVKKKAPRAFFGRKFPGTAFKKDK